MKTKCEVYSRTVGYIRPVNQWNKGKQEEFIKRKTLKVKTGDCSEIFLDAAKNNADVNAA